MRLAIVDFGCGNIGSVAIALERFGIEPVVTDAAETIGSADKVILPGVGAAGYAMEQIDRRGLREPLRRLTQPVLGICLGMQLLFERSEEEETECLGVIGGAVRKLEPSPGMPVPHMGWNRLSVGADDCGLCDGDYVYFAHSYACDPVPEAVATTRYSREVPAVVRRGNWLGAQFHPERSGAAGARFLKAFLDS